MKTIIYLPTKDKPNYLKRFINNFMETEADCDVAVYFDKGHHYKIDYEIPSNFMFHEGSEDGQGGAVYMNEFFEKYKDEYDVFAIVCDDAYPSTKKWDEILSRKSLEKGFSYPSDSEFKDKFSPHYFISKEFIEKAGGLNPLKFHHCGIDNFWFHLAKQSGRLTFCEEVIFNHDRKEPCLTNRDKDVKTWHEFRKSSEWKELIKKCSI